jgi:hypothetical protein
LNHPQYAGGYLDDAIFTLYGASTNAGLLARSSFDPKNTNFRQWDQVFTSNPRTVALSLKLTF